MASGLKDIEKALGSSSSESIKSDKEDKEPGCCFYTGKYITILSKWLFSLLKALILIIAHILGLFWYPCKERAADTCAHTHTHTHTHTHKTHTTHKTHETLKTHIKHTILLLLQPLPPGCRRSPGDTVSW